MTVVGSGVDYVGVTTGDGSPSERGFSERDSLNVLLHGVEVNENFESKISCSEYPYQMGLPSLRLKFLFFYLEMIP